jgi:small subunit ribosomal protein S21
VHPDEKLQGVTVIARDDESIESLIKRFKKKVNKSEILKDIKRHMFYEKPSSVRNRKKIDAEIKRKKEERKRGKE